jgi:hypothetical protein
MMRNIAIGLAAATIALGGSTLSASALYGKESGVSKGMSGSVQREHGRARELADLTPLQRERLKGIAHERLAELTPRQRAHLRGITRQLADLTPLQRERLRGSCANATPSSLHYSARA